MATKPQSNLPPQAQPWGRYVEESIATLERGSSINGQNSNNNLRQLNSSVQLLSQQQQELRAQQAELETQQDYLSGLITYTTSDAIGPYTNSTTQVVIKTVTLSFTLSQTYTVSFLATATGYISGNGGANMYVGGSAVATLQVDSNPTITGGYRGGSVYSNTSTVKYASYADVNLNHVATLSAGSHTITCKWYGNIESGNTGFVQILPAVITASVIS